MGLGFPPSLLATSLSITGAHHLDVFMAQMVLMVSGVDTCVHTRQFVYIKLAQPFVC